MNERYVKILQYVHRQATARIHLDNLVSDKFSLNGGVRHGDPISPKLFTAVMEEISKKADISVEICVDG